MGEGDWNASPTTVTVPPFLGPDDPGFVIGLAGADIPPVLQAFYNALGNVVVALLQVRRDEDDYAYLAMVRDIAPSSAVNLAIGHVIHDADVIPAIELFGFFSNPLGPGGNLIVIGDYVNGLTQDINVYAPIILNGVTAIANSGDWRYLLPSLSSAPVSAEVAHASFVTDSAGFTAETVVATITASLRDSVAYQVEFDGAFSTTVADTRVNVQIREDDISGTILQSTNTLLLNTAAGGIASRAVARYTATADGNKTFVVTGVRGSGTGTITREGTTLRPAFLSVLLRA